MMRWKTGIIILLVMASTAVVFVSQASRRSKADKKPGVATNADTTGKKSDSVAKIAAPPLDTASFTLPSGLKYQILKHGTGTRKPQLKDRLEFYLVIKNGDSIVFDYQSMNKGNPLPLWVAKPKFKGDPVEGYMQLVEGDSARFELPVDTLLTNGNKMPEWMKPGKVLEYDVVMLSVKTDSEYRKDEEFKVTHQKLIDDSTLQEYFKTNNLHPIKRPSGMYYEIKQQGQGKTPEKGNVVSVYYSGKFLNGNIFDTNEDSTFHHQDPFKVSVGTGAVIKGWDEGLSLLKKGAVARLYIPSGLAYGPKDRGQIPANSILIFDIIVKDIQSQEETDEHLLQDYFKENKITPLKTPGGVYYTINKKGKGPLAKAGETVSVKYTGRLLDSTLFDSNIDTNFHHTDPLKFELGTGRVIKGWDEGFMALNAGCKATLYIPSTMAYGPKRQGKILPNSNLIFDVELLSITDDKNKSAPAAEKAAKPKTKTTK